MNKTNIFLIADRLQATYKQFIKTFQKFRNPAIQQWVARKMDDAGLLYKPPLVELNYQFEKGKRLEDFVTEGHLDPQIPAIFPITPYQHQSTALQRVVVEGKNLVVSTGTGSGKSMCFWIPIVHTCLQQRAQGERGIKAVVVYPMNALANSQYDMIVEALRRTDLTVGRYTGDTPDSQEEAEGDFEKRYRRKPYPCEVISREAMWQEPPDVLITNYVMLDLILMRTEDKQLFPARFQKNLQYLVLDEVHTYAGNKGADVACLIRRLKERTRTRGSLRCIGTSATIQDTSAVAGQSAILQFARDLFGESFADDALVEATHVNVIPPASQHLDLPATVQVTPADVVAFDGSMSTAIPLAEQLLGRTLAPGERSVQGLGKLLHRHPTIIFIREALKDSACALDALAGRYQEDLRPAETLATCEQELAAAFLVGTVVQVTLDGVTRPLLVPKLHLFFTQGQEIASCLTGGPPHLTITGDLLCKECGTTPPAASPATPTTPGTAPGDASSASPGAPGDQGKRRTFPLLFCRNCGQEFYKVRIVDGEVFPGMAREEGEGEYAYLVPIVDAGDQKNTGWTPPDVWYDDRGELRRNYKDVLPEETEFCPDCNRLGGACSCGTRVRVYKIPNPMQFCPSCEIFYTKRTGEYGKLFSFNSTGRSTAIDILVAELLHLLPGDPRRNEKKTIVFTDNRQDTALQAEHLNEFQRRLKFRRVMLQTLRHADQHGLFVTDQDVGDVIFEYLRTAGQLPDFGRESEDEFTSAPRPDKEYKEFLTYLTLSDVTQSRYFLDLPLEKLGLLRIDYDGLEKLADHALVTGNDALSDLAALPVDQRYDFLRGVLDQFRWNGAIENPIFSDTVNLFEKWEAKIREAILFDLNNFRFKIVGYATSRPARNRKVWHNRQRVTFKSIAGNNSALLNWTKKVFPALASGEAKKLTEATVETLEQAKFLTPFHTTRPTFKLLQIRAGKLVFRLNQGQFQQCPKCQRVFYFRAWDACTNRNCPGLQTVETTALAGEHFYYQTYTRMVDILSEVLAREHSAQLSGKKRSEFEFSFKEKKVGTINVLVCTPTMELGIDIGDLSSIVMRNVPPDPSRYAQRAGRAGRQNQPSVISVFCGSGWARGPHDQYFYRNPEKIIAGKILTPAFLLDNVKLVRKHIHALVFETLAFRLPRKMEEIIDLNDPARLYPLKAHLQGQLTTEINVRFADLVSAIEQAFTHERAPTFEWFDTTFIETEIRSFVTQFDACFQQLREEYAQLDVERDFLNKQLAIKVTMDATRRRNAIEKQLEKIRAGKESYYPYNVLSNFGFLPNYSFPSATALLTMYYQKKGRYHENWRSTVIAIREFAPHNQIYFLGNKYRVTRAIVKTEAGEINRNKVYVCEHCNGILVGKTQAALTAQANCPMCGAEIKLSRFMDCIDFPHMNSISGAQITCDEETRRIQGYEVVINYEPNPARLKQFALDCPGGTTRGTLTYEHSGKVYLVNEGIISRSATTHERTVRPFNFCSACGQWLSSTQVEHHVDLDHADHCPRSGSGNNIYDNLWLFVEGNHDVVVFTFPVPDALEDHQVLAFYTSLKETILQSLMLTFNIEESEIDGFLNPRPGDKAQDIVVYETEEGGTGVLKALIDPTLDRFAKFLANLLQVVHVRSVTPFEEYLGACEQACYECLLRFRNQHEHALMNRKLVVPLVTTLGGCVLERVQATSGSDDQALQALLDGCESDLERAVLREMVAQGFPLPEGQKTVFDGDEPVTRPDFYYAQGHVCIFVDGPPHEPEDIQAQDKEKRDRIEGMGYVPVQVDLIDGDQSKIPAEVQKLKPYLGE